MIWEYPERLEKSSTKEITVYKNKVNGALILHDANDFANKQVYMGYGIQEAKRMFKKTFKGDSMSAYYPDIMREGLSVVQFDLIVGLLDDYTFDAQNLETEQEKQDFKNSLQAEYRNLKTYLVKDK